MGHNRNSAVARSERGKHFDPVLLDAFMEVLGRSGPDATRAQVRADPAEVAESSLETFAAALERGDAESAEGAIATAIEDGIAPIALHGEVIAPALRRVDELVAAAEIDADSKQLALGITRRVLATLYRYMLAGTEATREQVLVAALEGDEHPLELQMMHDELAAAGYRTTHKQASSAQELCTAVERQPSPVLGRLADGRLLATCDKVGHLIVWEVATGDKLAAIEAPTMYTWPSSTGA